jgi:ParB-like chromosome segregation protein Spo0J
MTAASFKSLSKDGTLKKADLFRVEFSKLVVEPGFNLRIAGAELDAHIDALTAYILGGGQVPPMEVRVDADGRVIIVDGHCRHAAFGKENAALAPNENIDVLPFRGNDVDRVARIITSAAGKALSLLEVAFGYKRLSAFNLSPEQIAQRFHKTRQHVEQALILANANADVHALVAAGTVSATLAIDAVRKHGEKAGEVLSGAAAKAKGEGKTKVTSKTVNGKPLPKKIVADMLTHVEKFHDSMPKATLIALASLDVGPDKPRQFVEVDALELMQLLDVRRDVVEFRNKEAERIREAELKARQGDLVGAE